MLLKQSSTGQQPEQLGQRRRCLLTHILRYDMYRNLRRYLHPTTGFLHQRCSLPPGYPVFHYLIRRRRQGYPRKGQRVSTIGRSCTGSTAPNSGGRRPEQLKTVRAKTWLSVAVWKNTAECRGTYCTGTGRTVGGISVYVRSIHHPPLRISGLRQDVPTQAHADKCKSLKALTVMKTPRKRGGTGTGTQVPRVSRANS